MWEPAYCSLQAVQFSQLRGANRKTHAHALFSRAGVTDRVGVSRWKAVSSQQVTLSQHRATEPTQAGQWVAVTLIFEPDKLLLSLLQGQANQLPAWLVLEMWKVVFVSFLKIEDEWRKQI